MTQRPIDTLPYGSPEYLRALEEERERVAHRRRQDKRHSTLILWLTALLEVTLTFFTGVSLVHHQWGDVFWFTAEVAILEVFRRLGRRRLDERLNTWDHSLMLLNRVIADVRRLHGDSTSPPRPNR